MFLLKKAIKTFIPNWRKLRFHKKLNSNWMSVNKSNKFYVGWLTQNTNQIKKQESTSFSQIFSHFLFLTLTFTSSLPGVNHLFSVSFWKNLIHNQANKRFDLPSSISLGMEVWNHFLFSNPFIICSCFNLRIVIIHTETLKGISQIKC